MSPIYLLISVQSQLRNVELRIPWYKIGWEVRAVLGGSKRGWLGLGARFVWVVGYSEARAAPLLIPCALCIQDRKDSPFPPSLPLPRDSHPTPIPGNANESIFSPVSRYGLWPQAGLGSAYTPSRLKTESGPLLSAHYSGKGDILDMSHIIMLLFYKVSWARKSSTCIC